MDGTFPGTSAHDLIVKASWTSPLEFILWSSVHLLFLHMLLYVAVQLLFHLDGQWVCVSFAVGHLERR